jgi:glycerol-3-phosphate dehydrogenase
VIWIYSDARPLFDEGGSESASAVSRDYGFDLGQESGGL